eukprot:jgi/Mesvir1/14730/Mv05378-RA.1
MDSDRGESLLAFCRAMPKVELHAHLHGCISLKTLDELTGGHSNPGGGTSGGSTSLADEHRGKDQQSAQQHAHQADQAPHTPQANEAGLPQEPYPQPSPQKNPEGATPPAAAATPPAVTASSNPPSPASQALPSPPQPLPPLSSTSLAATPSSATSSPAPAAGAGGATAAAPSHSKSSSPSPPNNSHSGTAPIPSTPAPITSMADAFAAFKRVHAAVSSLVTVRRLVAEALRDFAADNVGYVELRTTPRSIRGRSKQEYVQAVLEAMEETRSQLGPGAIVARLVLSIDRAKGLGDAEDTVDLAISLPREVVVGVDFSGNPMTASFGLFQPTLARARAAGLGVTVHFAEHWDEAEAREIMEFGPDRVGHAVCLDEALAGQLRRQRIPVELNVTSNVLTMPHLARCACCASGTACDPNTSACSRCNGWTEQEGAPAPCLCSIQGHPLRSFVEDETYPLCVCTDDPGIFCTSVSLELVRVARAFQLSRPALVRLMYRALGMLFDRRAARRVKDKLDAFVAAHHVDMSDSCPLPMMIDDESALRHDHVGPNSSPELTPIPAADPSARADNDNHAVVEAPAGMPPQPLEHFSTNKSHQTQQRQPQPKADSTGRVTSSLSAAATSSVRQAAPAVAAQSPVDTLWDPSWVPAQGEATIARRSRTILSAVPSAVSSSMGNTSKEEPQGVHTSSSTRPGHHTAAGVNGGISIAALSPPAVTLYAAWSCPRSQTAWIALEEAGVPYHYVEVNPWEVDPGAPGGYTRRPLPSATLRSRYPEFVAASPMGVLPALHHAGLGSAWGSLPLVEYVDAAFRGQGLTGDGGHDGGQPIVPVDPIARAHARVWAEYVENQLLPAFDRVLVLQDPEGQAKAKAAFLEGCCALGGAMADPVSGGGPYFLGAAFSIVDAALIPLWQRVEWIGPHYGQLMLPYADGTMPEFGRLQVWWDAVQAQPSVVATMVCKQRLIASYWQCTQGSVTSAAFGSDGLPSSDHASATGNQRLRRNVTKGMSKHEAARSILRAALPFTLGAVLGGLVLTPKASRHAKRC